jgi:hypothetical protein
MAREEEALCEHLRPVGEHLRASGASVTSAGRPWSRNCRYWVYFNVVLDVDALRRRFALPESVEVSRNDDPRSGLELGLVCSADHDAVMGVHPSAAKPGPSGR